MRSIFSSAIPMRGSFGMSYRIGVHAVMIVWQRRGCDGRFTMCRSCSIGWLYGVGGRPLTSNLCGRCFTVGSVMAACRCAVWRRFVRRANDTKRWLSSTKTRRTTSIMRMFFGRLCPSNLAILRGVRHSRLPSTPIQNIVLNSASNVCRSAAIAGQNRVCGAFGSVLSRGRLRRALAKKVGRIEQHVVHHGVKEVF